MSIIIPDLDVDWLISIKLFYKRENILLLEFIQNYYEQSAIHIECLIFNKSDTFVCVLVHKQYDTQSEILRIREKYIHI